MNVVATIFDEFRTRAFESEKSVEKMKKELDRFKDGIVLYGAGSSGIAFLSYLRVIGIYPKCFADGDSRKWGAKCEDIDIIDYHDITSRVGEDALVIVTINTDGIKYCKSFDETLRMGGHEGVHKNLKDAGCKNVIDYTFFRNVWELYQNEKYNLPSCSDVRLMLEHQTEIEHVYELLSDEKSKEVYEKIVRFRLIDDSTVIPTDSQENQYFEYNILEKIEDEVFIDCGAYTGNSLDVFLRQNKNQFAHYFGFEPDNTNYKKLQSYVEGLNISERQKMNIFNVALADTKGVQKMYCLNGPGSFLSETGNQTVVTTSIDDECKDYKITFIKMNIEGSELKVLKGAEGLIVRDRPRLAVAGYHRTADLWEIPLFIHTIDKSYSLYLRSYMNNISFIYYVK